MESDWRLPEHFDFEGQDVRWGVIGQGDPLVLVHGTPFSSIVWRRIAPWLAQHAQVFYFDLLGYGQSQKRDGQDVSLGIQNRLLSALLAHWKLGKPDVVAHDFGGTTSLRAHLLNGREYHTLTLIDPVAIRPWGSPFVQTARDYETVFAGLPGYIHEAILRAYLNGAVFNALRETEMALYMAPWLGAEGQAAFYHQIAQMDMRFTDEIEKKLSEIRCPVTILWGRDDDWIPLERGQELARRIPQARFRVVPEAKHLVQEDAPEAIVATVLDFITTKH
jgi:pimeloyl-ACP methyl ester carboxylesterase